MRTLEMIAVELRQAKANRAVAAATLAEAEAIEKALITEITSNLESLALTKATVGGFTISIRRLKVWTYSKRVAIMEKMLKSAKENEQKTGKATYTENRIWQCLNIAK